MFFNGKDYFFISTCKSTNSKVLLEKICSVLGAPYNENNAAFLKSKLQKATLEYRRNCTDIETKDGHIVTPYGDAGTIIIGLTQKRRKLNTKENIQKLVNALKDAKELYSTDPEKYHVSISTDNNKVNFDSVSILPFLFCPACAKETCGVECYAFAMALNEYHGGVVKAWAMNTAILQLDPVKYWEEISDAVNGQRFFRFHVSGEIVNREYFENMIKIARDNPKTDILCFTKQYEIVNSWIDKNGALPDNLHVLFSAWEDKIKIINPHNLPVTDVLNDTDPANDKIICGGNCFFCACRGVGCWTLKNGEKLYFYKH